MKIGVIGLGLIGGSFGISLREMKLISSVSGYDLNKENEQMALNLGLVDEIIDIEEMKKKCDVIFLAIPVEAIIKTLQILSDVKENVTI